MAIVLKSGRTYTDESKIDYTYLYGVIDCLPRLDKNKQAGGIIVDLYKDATSSNDGTLPVATHSEIIDQSAYQTYFATSVLSGSNVNPWSQAYAYVLSLSPIVTGKHFGR